MPPQASSSAEETRRILRFAVGRTFRVTEPGSHGLVGLDVSPDVDRKFGGFMHEIWVEEEHVEPDVPRLNEAPGRPSLGDVVHLVHGGSTAGHLKALGAKRVLMMMDSLTTGPASANPAKHLALRRGYWRNFFRQLPRLKGAKALRDSSPFGTVTSATDLKAGLRGRRSGQPVVLWCGADWDELLFVWWACDALLRCKVSPRDIWIASTTAEFNRYGKRELASVAHAEDEEVQRVFTFSRRCSASCLRRGARLWAAFAAGDLGALQRFRGDRTYVPPLGPLPPTAAAFVPQLRRGPTLRIGLTEYDSRLLGLFSSGDWCSAMGRLKNGATRNSFMSLMQEYGDLLIPARLATWATCAPDILEHRPASDAKRFLDAVEYRLTDRGIAILQGDLAAPAIAPPIAVGGFVAYAADMKWASESTEDAWRFVRLVVPSLRAATPGRGGNFSTRLREVS
jgi:hypothetical protein